MVSSTPWIFTSAAVGCSGVLAVVDGRDEALIGVRRDINMSAVRKRWLLEKLVFVQRIGTGTCTEYSVPARENLGQAPGAIKNGGRKWEPLRQDSGPTDQTE